MYGCRVAQSRWAGPAADRLRPVGYSSGWRAMDWGSRPASSHPQIAASSGRPMRMVIKFSTGSCLMG
jgi:hypothetical protein